MVPVLQSQFTSEDGRVRGNCLAACVASLLECPIESVPHFIEQSDWHRAFLDFLGTTPLEFQGTLYVHDRMDWWKELTDKCRGVEGHFLVCGPSPRRYVFGGHAVLYKDARLAHDPHPSGEGLIRPAYILMLEKRVSLQTS